VRVPFCDLPRQYRDLQAELDAAVLGVLSRGDFILGEDVQRFETEFASFCGASHCVGVASGTDALHLMLRALQIGPGDEVVTVANTFVATVQAISLAGATPVLVDCLEATGLVDPRATAEVLTDRTRAVIAVHLYGQPADMRGLEPVCRARGVALLEDAAQAHGASLEDGRRCGSLGMAAGFSFYPSKNLGAAGDGGAITTSDAELARRLRSLRNWGAAVKYEHRDKGWNSRLDTIQAALLRVKLRHLERWNAARARAADWYRERLAELPGVVSLAKAPWTGTHAHHLFVVRIPGLQDRNTLLSRLAAAGVEAGVHYPRAVHQQPAYAELGATGSFPVAERLCTEVISLPMFPEITEAQVDHVVSTLRSLV